MANVPDSIRALVVALHQLGGGAILQGQAGARLNITSLGTGTDTPWEDCYSVDVSARVLARVIEALGGPAGVG
ncbi:hypothetical protein, partial [Streptomyces sp. sk2.1]|uniref:hypothetical protein n=1 Tax=Streptomyces sp. sk2.1 TaxID=2478959 RepID=UPI0011E7D30C